MDKKELPVQLRSADAKGRLGLVAVRSGVEGGSGTLLKIIRGDDTPEPVLTQLSEFVATSDLFKH